MPTSDYFNIAPILSVLTNAKPKSVLDVGCGFGKYGVLLREYLDIWHRRYSRSDWQTRIVGIDAFAEYRNPIWDYAYSEVYVGEAQQLLPTLGEFDAVLISDVIEHLEKADATVLVSAALKVSPLVVISTPREFFAQEDAFENPYEIHRCHWSAGDCPAGHFCRTIKALGCNVYVLSREPLAEEKLGTADVADQLYVRSRQRLKNLGIVAWPISALVRKLNRWFC